MKRYPVVKRGDYLDLTETGHLMWIRDNNPDGWDDETWRAFAERCSMSEGFKAEAQRCKREGLPRPHPTADGWVTSKRFDPIAGLSKNARLRVVK